MDPIARLAKPNYWRRRRVSQGRVLWFARRWTLGRRAIDELAVRTREAWGLAAASMWVLLGSIGTYALLVAISALCELWEPTSWLGERLKDREYRDLLAAAVGALGAFLGLYFATVGVVASTVYQQVPAAIRGLFLELPSGKVYVRGVVRAIVLGVMVLVTGAIDFNPSPVELFAAAILTVIATLRLLVLGSQLFRFFDPTSLAGQLNRRFYRALRVATSSRTRSNQAALEAAHSEAADALSTYRDLAILVEDSKKRSDEGSIRITQQVVHMLWKYSRVKHLIPSDSAWWTRTPAYQNWMTSGPLDRYLGVTAATRSPEAVPDRLWVERLVVSVLGLSLRDVARAGGPSRVLAFASQIDELIFQLASRLQVDEAILLMQFWEAIANEILREDQSPNALDDIGIAKLAAAEQLVAPTISLWQGLVGGAETAASHDFGAHFVQSVNARQPIEMVVLPPMARSELERFVLAGREEVRAEGRLVTGGWWAGHFLARFTSEYLHTSYKKLVARVDALNSALAGERSPEDAENRAIAIWSLLDLHEHLAQRHGSFLRSLEVLRAHKREQTNNRDWPQTDIGGEWPREASNDVLLQLSTLLPELRTERHDSRRPDLHGQAFRRLFDETFYRLLRGHSAISGKLLTSLIAEADVLRARVFADREGFEPTATVALALEPFESVLELSGYARLMQELDGQGVWEEVEAAWDEYLARNGGESAAVGVAEQHAFYSQPGVGIRALMGPTSRYQEYRAFIADRDSAQSNQPKSRGNRKLSKKPESVSEVYSGNELGMHQNLVDLFIVEYLVQRLPQGYELPRDASFLAKRLGKEGGGNERV